MTKLHSLRILLALAATLVVVPAHAAPATCQVGVKVPPSLDLIEEAYDILANMFVEPLPAQQLLASARTAVLDEVGTTPAPAASLEPATPRPATRATNREWDSFADQYCAIWGAKDEALPEDRIAYAAIRAMVDVADEAHTRFMTPQMYDEHQKWSSGDVRYEGIGARLRGSPLSIHSTFPDSPAEIGGLLAGDQIQSIDGTPSSDLSAADAVNLVRGEAGSTVHLEVSRPGVAGLLEFDLVRSSVRIPMVEARVVDDVAYLSILGFPTPALYDDVLAGLDLAERQGAEALVLDLRGNSGGRLDVGSSVASIFLDEGTPIYRQTTRRGRSLTATAVPEMSWSKPMAVLIDDGTASMGEILAAALQEQGAARLYGTTTSGAVAGSVVVPLKDGSAMQVTTLRIDSGLGEILNNIGVRPDFEIDTSTEDALAGKDPVLDAATEDLKALINESKAHAATTTSELEEIAA